MKKRKELDALLMNGKKSRPKRSKDGHELLQNMDSDSNSSELDEFIMQPRKQTIVRRKIALCSVCLRLLVFILVVACIATTALAVWMNVQLKNDLDELRKKMTVVESSLSKSQGSSLDESQEQQLKLIPTLTTNIGILNDSLIRVNKSLETLKSDVPIIALAKVDPVDTKYSKIMADTKDTLTNLGNEVKKIQDSMDTVKLDVSTLKEQSSHLSQGPTQAPAKVVTNPPNNKAEPDSASSLDILSVRKSLETLSDTINRLNQTVIDLASEVSKQQGGSIPAGDSSELLQKLQKNVTYLMEVVQKELSTDDVLTEAPSEASSGGATLPPAFNLTAWQHQIENRLGTLEIEVKQLNPSDLNNNLLNNDTARGIQTILENTYKVFRDEINDKIQAWNSNQTELANRISKESLLLSDLTIRVDHLEFQVQNTSADETLEDSPAKDGNLEGDNSVHITEPSSGNPKNEPGDNEKSSTPPVGVFPTVAPDITQDSPGTTHNSQTDSPSETVQQTPPTEISSSILTKPEDVTSISEGVTDLENLKKTLPSSAGSRSMASRSVASLTGATELITGVENGASTNAGTTSKTTEQETPTKQKLATTPSPPPPLIVPGISTKRVFQRQFHNWDVNQNGKVDYTEFSHLRSFHGNAPPKDEFLAHDQDGDGELNKEEMQAALGFRKR